MSSRARPIIEQALTEHAMIEYGEGAANLQNFFVQCMCGGSYQTREAARAHLADVLTESIDRDLLHFPKRPKEHENLFPGDWQAGGCVR